MSRMRGMRWMPSLVFLTLALNCISWSNSDYKMTDDHPIVDQAQEI
jgi:hypothetical protein